MPSNRDDDLAKLVPGDSVPLKNKTTEPHVEMLTAGVALDSRAQALIGQRLKAMYHQIVEQPVPDHLLKLLEDLEKAEKAEKKS